MTNKEKVRLLIGDKTVPYHFEDAEIQAFLDMAGDSIYLAAAMALEAWAASLSEDTDSERIGDYGYTKKQVDNKLKLAERYRKSEAETPAMTWASLDLLRVTEETEE